jgi:hypothetical protein
VEDAYRTGLLRTLAIFGLFLVLFLQAPFSAATLSLIEPFLVAILLSAWFTSYYIAATLGRKYGVKSIPLFRRFLPSHFRVADGLMFLALALSVVFVWAVWSSQPFRIFNATVLGTLWTGIALTGRLGEWRRYSASTTP